MSDPCDELEPLGSAWLDGELDAGEAAAVTAHLARCPACRDELDGLARTRAQLRSLPVRRVPAGLLDDVPADAGDPADATVPAPPDTVEERGATALSRGRRRASRAAVTLAALGVLGGAAFSLGERPPEARTVTVPVDLFVADHVAQSAGAAVWSPALAGASP